MAEAAWRLNYARLAAMAVAQIVDVLLEATPILRGLWRRLLERGIEVTVLPPLDPGGKEREAEPVIEVDRDPLPAVGRTIYADFALRLINHRTDRKERVRAGRLEIKKPRLFLWRQTVWQAPISGRRPPSAQPPGQPMANLVLKPMSAPVEVECRVLGKLDEPLPKRSELWLVLEMIGPIRRVQRKIMNLAQRS